MRLTYPHMGEAYIAVKSLMDDIGVESIIPAFTTNSTLRLGSSLSPEAVCLPYKIMLGNYINSINAGADTILITGSCGPCRFGYYGPLQKQALWEAGYKDTDIIILDPPREGYRKFLEALKKVAGKNSGRIIPSFINAYKVCCELDSMNELLYYTRPRAFKKDELRSIMHKFKSDVMAVKGSGQMLELIHDTKNRIRGIDIDKSFKPLKIGIIGEIYTIIEPFSNLHTEERLGDLGVEVHRSMTVRDWARNNVIFPATGRKGYKLEKKLSKPYLPALIGGHTQQCIGHAVHYAKTGYDGLVQIYPMTCMPEIVSRSILSQVEKDYNIPILYLIVDEQTGEAGFQTRLEAFVDYVNARQEARDTRH
ncbi:MAG TPA: CoA protein activase [Bacillota bacterium]|nr:CoA protein activase [Bacillota bacterium]HQA66660.1 CoA protein activase [Bacillota bacterium]HQO42204.1 CoA protein activase [Bacillota bacterium]HQQ45712.1 CoA protein activase [Bacillota bacterium]